jgi:hypothetical protein
LFFRQFTGSIRTSYWFVPYFEDLDIQNPETQGPGELRDPTETQGLTTRTEKKRTLRPRHPDTDTETKDPRTRRHRNPRSQKNPKTHIIPQRPRDTQRHREQTQRHRDTGTQRHRDTGPKDTKTQGPKSSSKEPRIQRPKDPENSETHIFKTP